VKNREGGTVLESTLRFAPERKGRGMSTIRPSSRRCWRRRRSRRHSLPGRQCAYRRRASASGHAVEL